MPAPDFLIIGGGIVGRSLAYHLAGAGAAVTVVDRGCTGGAASGAAAGMLAPLSEADGPGPFLDFGLAALAYYADLVTQLEAEAGTRVEYSPCGLLRVAFDEAGAEDLRERVVWQRAAGSVEWVEAGEAARLEPALAPAACGAFYPQEHHVNAPAMVAALAMAGARRGVRWLEGAEAVGFQTQGARVTGIRLRGGAPDRLEAGHVVIAAGAWTGLIGEWLGADLPVFPVRGQVMAFTQPSPPVAHIIFAGGRGYAVPKAGGTVTVGATEDRSGFDAYVTAAGMAYISRVAIQMVPGMERSRFHRAWAGLRPGSADALPLIGPVPGWEGLAVASGHFRNGILLGPLTGKLLTERLTGHPAPEVGQDLLAPFDPGRFGPLFEQQGTP